jgi:hypothetical protein
MIQKLRATETKLSVDGGKFTHGSTAARTSHTGWPPSDSIAGPS